MYNDLLRIGPVVIHSYGLMMAVGIVSGFRVAEKRAPKYGLDPDVLFSALLTLALGVIVGAKLLFYLTVLPEIIADPSYILDNLMDGFVIYGAIIGGILSGLWYCKRHKLRFLPYFDLVIPSVALAQGFGRIGCFLAGCCYGKETTGPLAVVFRNSDFAPNGVPLIPTQLISSALDFLHFFFLIWFAKNRKKRDGEVAALYLILYSIGRFIIEFFRGDVERGFVGALSTSQFISIFTLAAGIAMMVMFFTAQKKAVPLTADGLTLVEEAAEEAEELPREERLPGEAEELPGEERLPEETGELSGEERLPEETEELPGEKRLPEEAGTWSEEEKS